MDRQSVPEEAVQPQVERRIAPVGAPPTTTGKSEYIVTIHAIGRYAAVCAVTAWDAVITAGVKPGAKVSVMNVGRTRRFHSHCESGRCALAYWHPSQPPGTAMRDELRERRNAGQHEYQY